jgi:hypothetical protein
MESNIEFYIFFSRIKTYNESTVPIIMHFDKLDMVKRIDAAKTEEEVS